LTNEELVQLHQRGDSQALEMIIEKNKGIIYKLVNKFYVEGSNSIDQEDLVQEGMIGLIIAANKYKFDIKKPCKYSTYAVYWIYAKINRFITRRNTSSEISLNTPLGNKEDMELIDVLKSDNDSYENIDKKIYNKQLRDELENVMLERNTLREREILKLHYGWHNNSCMTLEEIGYIFEVSKENVRQSENKALRKIRCSPWGRKMIEEHIKEVIISKRYKRTQEAALYKIRHEKFLSKICFYG
jgi:RNA polymerase primary sigma factor/RNA polymerase sporulation-specific sigma factor